MNAIRSILVKLTDHLKKRFQEHLSDYKYRNGKSKFAQHLLDNEHSIGPMEDVMKILHINNKKGKMMNTLENFFIYVKK